ncbi:MAG: hypothetical protein HC921_19865 [Synechococcaceae cyanobacterium SM2_3_1]|nr:hypothetical protein [Synechococcaceae cyanobacterium SM2_3_1]
MELVANQDQKALMTPGDGEPGTGAGDPGTYNVRLQVVDGQGGEATQSCQIFVSPDPENQSPNISSLPIPQALRTVTISMMSWQRIRMGISSPTPCCRDLVA